MLAADSSTHDRAMARIEASIAAQVAAGKATDERS